MTRRARGPGDPPTRIAAVDDDAPTRRLLVDALASTDRRVVTFETGDLLLQHLEQPDPCDLLIVDIQMPGLDGFAIVHEVRRRPHLAGLPILALTGLSARDAAARIMEAGADAYLRKPVDIAELIRVVDDLVGADVDADTPPDEAPHAESGPDADADADTHADAPADAQVVEEHLRPAAILDALERTAARGGVVRVEEQPPRRDAPIEGDPPTRVVSFTVDARTYDAARDARGAEVRGAGPPRAVVPRARKARIARRRAEDAPEA